MSANRSHRRRQDRILRQGGRRYDRDGCSRCGGSGAISAAYVLADAKPVCGDCVTDADRARVVGTIVDLALASDGMEDDRRWFLAHPGVEWRLRKPFHMEKQELLARDHYLNLSLGGGPRRTGGYDEATATTVLTVQAEPGQRARVLCTPPDDEAEVLAWLEQVALPVTRQRIANSMPHVRSLTPEHRFRADNALVFTHVPGGERLFAEAAEQGRAMAEARRSTRQ